MPKKTAKSKTYKWVVVVTFYTDNIYAFCIELFHNNVPESHSLQGSYNRYHLRNSFLAYSDAVEWAEQVKDIVLENVPQSQCGLHVEIDLSEQDIVDDKENSED